jgi:hypothetical protein
MNQQANKAEKKSGISPDFPIWEGSVKLRLWRLKTISKEGKPPVCSMWAVNFGYARLSCGASKKLPHRACYTSA